MSLDVIYEVVADNVVVRTCDCEQAAAEAAKIIGSAAVVRPVEPWRKGGVMAIKLSDGGHLAKLANGTIIRFDRSGSQVETLKPGDSGYSYWFSLVSKNETAKRPQR